MPESLSAAQKLTEKLKVCEYIQAGDASEVLRLIYYALNECLKNTREELSRTKATLQEMTQQYHVATNETDVLRDRMDHEGAYQSRFREKSLRFSDELIHRADLKSIDIKAHDCITVHGNDALEATGTTLKDALDNLEALRAYWAAFGTNEQ